MKFRKLLCGALATLGIFASSGASASILTFDLDGIFNSGSVLSGSFALDSTTGLATSVDVVISAPASLSFTSLEAQFVPFAGVYQLQIGDGTAGLPDLNIGLSIDAAASNLLGYTGGSLLTGSNIFYSANTSDSLTGTATLRVAEPITTGLLALGLLAASYSRRRHAH